MEANSTNGITSTQDSNITNDYRNIFIYTVPVLTVFCAISVIVNIKVLLAVRWLRRPISPTIHFSLSLAAADAASSFLLGYHIVANILFESENCYAAIYVEMYRLSCIIIAVVHLSVLSMNHWLGVLKPLHYTCMMTTRRVTIVITFLWITPIAFFNVYFFAQNAYNESGCLEFLDGFTFRITFSAIFFVSLIAMVFFYVHILVIVMKHQVEWKKLSRSGSRRSRYSTSRTEQQRRTIQGTIKAVCTTLLIVGSCLIGWLPSVLKFALICKNGCCFHPEMINISTEANLFLAHLAYFLLILKTLANPIIYSRRMVEIKEATHRMNAELCGWLCRSYERRDITYSDTQSLPLGCSSSI